MNINPKLFKLQTSSEMTIYQAQLGPYANLNHLIVCNETNSAAMVDPFSGNYWIKVIDELKVDLKMILLTHTHSDHVNGLSSMLSKYSGINVWVHADEEKRGWNGPDTNRWNHHANSVKKLKLGSLELQIHCTPGHSPGHVSIIGHGSIIAGDLLFLGRCGRTDLYGGNKLSMYNSLMYFRKQLLELPGEWLVFPGHQYPLDDGSNPMHLTVAKLLEVNSAIADQEYDDFSRLEYLEFKDSLSIN